MITNHSCYTQATFWHELFRLYLVRSLTFIVASLKRLRLLYVKSYIQYCEQLYTHCWCGPKATGKQSSPRLISSMSSACTYQQYMFRPSYVCCIYPFQDRHGDLLDMSQFGLFWDSTAVYVLVMKQMYTQTLWVELETWHSMCSWSVCSQTLQAANSLSAKHTPLFQLFILFKVCRFSSTDLLAFLWSYILEVFVV